MDVAGVDETGGVGATSRILKSGRKAVKCRGTSVPRWWAIQAHSASISLSESLWPGMSSVVISSQTSVQCRRYISVSSTGSRRPAQVRR